VLAGVLAFGGGCFVLLAAKWQSKSQRETERANTAAAFIGDISAWQSFLRNENVASTLTLKAGAREVIYFHPGDSWLKVYFSDPRRVGYFSESVAQILTYYYSRMSGEIGRLIWLHGLARLPSAQADWFFDQMRDCAKSIDALTKEGESLIKRLIAERTLAERALNASLIKSVTEKVFRIAARRGIAGRRKVLGVS
jgi:hypothetical protein